MTMEVCETTRIVYYWLSSDERDSSSTLNEDYRRWKSKGYKVCTFVSGDGNLVDLTKDLLVHNKQVVAQTQITTTCGGEGNDLVSLS